MANAPTNKPTTKTAIDEIAGADITNLYLLYVITNCVCVGSEYNIITENFLIFLEGREQMLLIGSHRGFLTLIMSLSSLNPVGAVE